MHVRFWRLFRRSRVEQRARAESILGHHRLVIVQGSRHPQGWSELKQVFIISCEVEGEFIVSNWILTRAANSDLKILFKCGPVPRYP